MSLRGLQFLTLFCIGSLFALTGMRQFFIEPLASQTSNIVWFLIQVSPLLGLLPGVLRLKPRSYLLATLAAMLYFSHGVMVIATQTLRTFGIWETGFAMALVLSASFALRHLRMAAADRDAPDDQ